MTIKDIARISGYGIGTVSRVINNQTGVSDAAREKILRVIEENGFEPNVNAKLLKNVSEIGGGCHHKRKPEYAVCGYSRADTEPACWI